MKLLKLFLLVFAILTVAISSIAQRSVQGDNSFSASDLRGVVKEGKYSNSYFGFELQFPKTWSVLDQEETEATIKIGSEALRTENGRPNRELEDSQRSEIVLLQVTKKPLGVSENAMFIMAIQKQPSNSVLPKMVAEATKSVLLKSSNIRVVKDVHEKTIGGKRFALVDYEIEVGAEVVRAQTFVTVIKGFALSIGLSHPSTMNEPELAKILDTLKFSLK